MPVPYVPKPIKVINLKTFQKLGLNLSDLSRAQTKALDEITSLIKPANKRSDLREDVADTLSELFNYVKGLPAPQCRDTIRSVRNQISKGGNYKQDPKGFRFAIPTEIIEYLNQ